MGFEIITLSPFWYILVCLFIAGGFTWLLYRKHIFEVPALVWLMRVLRFLGLFLVFVLLMAPLVRLRVHKEVKPGLLFFLDKSISVNDSAIKNTEILLKNVARQLEGNYEIRQYDFAGNVVVHGDSGIQKKYTSISSVFDYTNEVLEGKNIRKIIIISDGIHNSGINPLFQRLTKPANVYTVGIGDTIQYPDVWISDVESNSTVFFENEFTIGASLRCSVLPVKQIAVELWEDGRRIQQQVWNRTSGSGDFGKVAFVVKPTSVGLKHYEIKIPLIAGENNVSNNSKNVWIQVTDTRRKIAIIAHAANPDIAAISRALESNVQYEVKKYDNNNLPATNAFDVAVCHGFPATVEEVNYLKELLAAKRAFWVIFTAQTNPGFIRSAEFGIDPANAGGMNNAQAFLNANFNEFLFPEELSSQVRNWPPLQSPYGRYRTGPGFKTLFFQKIGAVNSEIPLFGFTSTNGSRQAWLFGEGLWKWRLRDFERNRAFTNFDDLMAKTIQYLGSAEVKQKFRVYLPKPEVDKDENVIIAAEYLNQSMEPDNRQDCELLVTGENGFSKNVKFAKNDKRYRADLGQLPPGNYKFTATVKSAARETTTGNFSVTDHPLELENTVADHGLLRKLSAMHQGQYYETSEWSRLISDLNKNVGGSNLLVEEMKVTEWIRWKWLFAFIILLFSLEWFLRKREGAY